MITCALCSPMPVISSSRSTVVQSRACGQGVGSHADRVPVVGPSRRGSTGWASGIAASSSLDAGGEGVDLGGQRVDLVQQHPGQLGVVVVEAAVKRLDQRRRAWPSSGRGPGSASAVGSRSPGDQRLDHVARRQRVQLSEATADTLISASSSSFSSRCQ